MCEPPTPDSTRRQSIPARSIRLADGDDWSFSAPMVRLIPRIQVEPDLFGRPVERMTVKLGFGYPLSIQRKLDVLRSSWDCESVSLQCEAFFSLAASLLMRAHDISLTTACELLAVPEKELPRLVEQVISLVSSEPRNEET